MKCSNCGCDQSMHTLAPQHSGWGPGCGMRDQGGHLIHPAPFCWGGFDTQPGGTNAGVCSGRNGHKSWCKTQHGESPNPQPQKQSPHGPVPGVWKNDGPETWLDDWDLLPDA